LIELNVNKSKVTFHAQRLSCFEYKCFKSVFFQAIILLGFILAAALLSSVDNLLTLHPVLDLSQTMPLLYGIRTSTDATQSLTRLLHFCLNRVPSNYSYALYEGWNFNSGNYLFTTDTK